MQLSELLTPELLTTHHQHIVDFLEMEGIVPAADLGDTDVSDRQAKELLAEMAHDVDQHEDRNV